MTAEPRSKARRPLPLVEARSCGSCFACCVVFRIDEAPAKKADHVPCSLLSTGARGGQCGVYEARPKTCRDFLCLWMRGAGGDEDRPDKRGVVLHELPHPVDQSSIVVVTEVVDGALADGSPGDEIARAIGAQTHVLKMFRDGRRQAIVPVQLTIR